MSEKVKIGDLLWVELKGSDQNYGYGEVVEVWTDPNTGIEFFDFFCLVNGGQRSGRVDKIIEKPNGRMTSKMIIAQKALKEVLNKK